MNLQVYKQPYYKKNSLCFQPENYMRKSTIDRYPIHSSTRNRIINYGILSEKRSIKVHHYSK